MSSSLDHNKAHFRIKKDILFFVANFSSFLETFIIEKYDIRLFKLTPYEKNNNGKTLV